ncbi:MAG: ECF-type sigma factor [Pseudomonadota bacterium]
MSDSIEITSLLEDWKRGDPASQQRVLEAVFPELKKIAANSLARQGGRLTLQATEVVNEAYMKLLDQRNHSWENRGHFFSIMARLMRRLIIDHLRGRLSDKRGNGIAPVNADDIDIPVPSNYPDWIELDCALNELEEINPGAARVVELRQIVGLSIDETAKALDLGTATVGRHWRFARAWLAARLKEHV